MLIFLLVYRFDTISHLLHVDRYDTKQVSTYTLETTRLVSFQDQRPTIYGPLHYERETGTYTFVYRDTGTLVTFGKT